MVHKIKTSDCDNSEVLQLTSCKDAKDSLSPSSSSTIKELEAVESMKIGRVHTFKFVAFAFSIKEFIALVDNPIYQVKRGVTTFKEKLASTFMYSLLGDTYNSFANNSMIRNALFLNVDSIYRFMARADIFWPGLLISLAIQAVVRVMNHNNLYLIVDDTIIERKEGFKCEGIAYQYNHASDKNVLGYTNLCIAITDGNITIPLTMSLNTSSDKPVKHEKRGRPPKGSNTKELTSSRLNNFSEEEEGTYAFAYKQRMQICTKFETFFQDLSFVLSKLEDAGLRDKVKGLCSDSWFTSSQEFQTKVNEAGLHYYGAVKCGQNKGEFSIKGITKGIFSFKEICDIEEKFAKAATEYSQQYMVKPVKDGVVSDNEKSLNIYTNHAPNSNRVVLPVLNSDTSASKEEVSDIYDNRVQIEPVFRVIKDAAKMIKGSEARKLNCINAHIHITAMLFIIAVLYIMTQLVDTETTVYELENKQHDELL